MNSLNITQDGGCRTIRFGTQSITIDYDSHANLEPPPGVHFDVDSFLLFLVSTADKGNSPEFLKLLLELRERLSDHPEEVKAWSQLISSFVVVDSRSHVLIEHKEWMEATALLETAARVEHVKDLYVGEDDA